MLIIKTTLRLIISITWLVFFVRGGLLLGYRAFRKFQLPTRISFKKNKKYIVLELDSTKTDIAMLTEIFLFEVYSLERIDSINSFVDCGANKGLTSIYVSLYNPNCNCICIEANPALIPSLKKNLEVNNVQFEIINKAISNAVGYVDFTISENHQYSGITISLPIENISGNIIKVEQILSSDVINQTIDLCKIDVEGFEEYVLKGIKSFPKNIFLEIHEDRVNVEAIYSTLTNNYFNIIGLGGVKKFLLLTYERYGILKCYNSKQVGSTL